MDDIRSRRYKLNKVRLIFFNTSLTLESWSPIPDTFSYTYPVSWERKNMLYGDCMSKFGDRYPVVWECTQILKYKGKSLLITLLKKDYYKVF